MHQLQPVLARYRNTDRADAREISRPRNERTPPSGETRADSREIYLSKVCSLKARARGNTDTHGIHAYVFSRDLGLHVDTPPDSVYFPCADLLVFFFFFPFSSPAATTRCCWNVSAGEISDEKSVELKVSTIHALLSFAPFQQRRVSLHFLQSFNP